MSKQDVLYFAHAVNAYDTPYETAAIALISETFPRADIENPNQPHHQEGYVAYQERTAKNRDDHKGMSYFYDEVLPNCTGCVSMPFLDGRFGLGVAGETKQCLENGLPTYGIFPSNKNASPLQLSDWVADPLNGLFVIRPFTNPERDEFLATDKEGSVLVVGHQETRLRTWFVYGRERRPYEIAHEVSMPIPEGFYPPEKK